MASIIPSLEKIKKLKQPVTEGELYLLEALNDFFDANTKIYFNPYFNGDRPDIVILDPTRGVIVVEVKDWELSRYRIESSKTWVVDSNDQPIKSPHAQVFGYKKNIFDIHVNGLLEKRLRNYSFYKIINVFVFFYSESKVGINNFFSMFIDGFQDEINKLNALMKNKNILFSEYERKIDKASRKKKNLERDLRLSVGKDQLDKIKFPFKSKAELFPQGVFDEFSRLLNPPFHYAHEGKELVYSKKQARLCESRVAERQKISGVAGSGKTTVLAKKAVNAFKRHEEPVLILTYNLTLRMYIRDKISEVREDFPWSAFEIINYHQFMSIALNSSGVAVSVPDAVTNDSDLLDNYLEDNYYSNLKIFEEKEIKNSYKTILIDEVQDYKPEWIKIIKKFFLHEDGEMVLFGDEKQNLYKREMDSEKKITVPNGFGRWEKLTKSYRYQNSSSILNLTRDFQSEFLSSLYDIDEDEAIQDSLITVGINAVQEYEKCSSEIVCGFRSVATHIASKIVAIAKKNGVHPNDITIISSSTRLIREIDYILRKGKNKERTLTTFETLEMHSSPRFKKEAKSIRRAKKFGFNLNSGVIKLSTVHSFKGFESPTVFVLVEKDDSPELVYTALTRARQNIIVFCEKDSKYLAFFSGRLAPVSSFL